MTVGTLRQQEDVDEEMDQSDDPELNDGTDAHSASVMSFADGLPQGEPSYQRTEHADVDQLV